MKNSRAIAAEIISKLLSQHGSLSSHLDRYKETENFQLLQEMCFGCCRWFHLLDFFLGELLSKPLKNKDQDIKALLLVGLYQLREMRVPDHAAINETVEAAGQLKKPWAKSLANGVLRNFTRNRQALEDKLSAQSLAQRLSHPQWLVDSLAGSWPDHLPDLLSNNNARPPMTLRVNLARISRADYLTKLNNIDLPAQPGQLSPSAVYLHNPMPVGSLPGFAEGEVSVQDEASQLVAGLLQAEPGDRVLDACAAPGGKACHILESEHSLSELVALDKEPHRLERVRENLQRLQLQATVVAADAAETDLWWNKQPFDRILLDAPCSATGVVRRHPDIKLLRSQNDITRLARQQQQILEALWPCLKTGGRLLYTSCSVLEAENSAIMARFLSEKADAKYEGVETDWGVECSYGRQLLPLEQNGPDGFFYSLLRKI